jgi:hypothetical protein
MKRRAFCVGVTAAAVVAAVPVRALLRPRDDTDYIQGLVDRGDTIPPGEYYMRRSLNACGRHLDARHCIFHFCGVTVCILTSVETTGDFSYNYLMGELT